MKILSYLTIGLLAFGAAACSGDAKTCDQNCGQGGDGAQGGSGGQGAQGGGGQGAGGQGAGGQGAGGQGAGGGQVSCGGFTGQVCDAGSFCNYQPSSCGVADGGGECQSIPTECPDINDPTCGCDGQVYGNPCEANAAGVDIALIGGCTPPNASLFPCGASFCNIATEYCRRDVSDVSGFDDSFACQPLPSACGNTPSCACLGNEPCANMCSADNLGGLTVTCPGG